MKMDAQSKNKRTYLTTLIALSVVLVLIPVLGFPARIDDRIILVIGLIILIISIYLRRDLLSISSKNESLEELENTRKDETIQ